MPGEPLPEQFAIADKALLDSLVEPVYRLLNLPPLPLERRLLFNRFRPLLKNFLGDTGQNFFQAFRLKQPGFQSAQDNLIQLGHGNASARAAGFALGGGSGACVVAISAALAGSQRHSRSAMRAGGDLRQQHGTVRETGSLYRRASGLKVPLHGLECIGLDNVGNLYRNPFRRIAEPVGLADPPVVVVDAHAGAPPQDAMHLVYAERPPATIRKALGIQGADNSLDAHRSAAIPVQAEPVNHPHNLGFGRIDIEALLDRVAASLRFDRAIAIWRVASVEEALPGVLQHGLRHARRSLFVFHLCNKTEDAPRHLSGKALPDLFGCGLHDNAALFELAEVNLLMDLVPVEPGKAVNHDHFERVIRRKRVVDHAFEFRPVVVAGTSPGFRVHRDDIQFTSAAEFLHRLELVGNRYVLFRLACRGNAEIYRGFHS